MLDRLLASDGFDRANRPPAGQRGVYLFSEGDNHLYVGRTGITARTRKAGTAPTTSFRVRFDQHTQAGQSPGSAPFAMRLALADARDEGIAAPPSGWWKHKANYQEFNGLFLDAKRRIGDEMSTRIVPFDDDILGVRSAIAEMYVHAILRTPCNDFSPS
jgi:hypothetical protein